MSCDSPRVSPLSGYGSSAGGPPSPGIVHACRPSLSCFTDLCGLMCTAIAAYPCMHRMCRGRLGAPDPPPLNPNPLLAAHRRHGSLARPRCARPLAPVCPSPHTYRSARLSVRQLAVGPLVGLSHHSIMMYRMCGAMPFRHLRPAMTRHGGGAKPPRIHPKVSHPRHPTRLPGCPNAPTRPPRPYTRHISDSKYVCARTQAQGFVSFRAGRAHALSHAE